MEKIRVQSHETKKIYNKDVTLVSDGAEDKNGNTYSLIGKDDIGLIWRKDNKWSSKRLFRNNGK